jgi:hypothetical protein
MIQRLDRFTTLAILVVTVLYTLTALQFPGTAKIVPSIFGGIAIVLLLIQLFAPWFSTFRVLSGEFTVDGENDLVLFHERSARGRFLIIASSLLAVPLLIALFGLAFALPLYVAVLLLAQRQSFFVVIVCTSLIMAISYGLLVRLLAWPWNDGLFWTLLS